MGWTFREADVDNNTRLQLVMQEYDFEESRFISKVIYGSQNGSVCYLAVRRTSLITGESKVYGVVVLTAIDRKSDYNFGTKPISEDMGPHYYCAPKKLISLLSPTTSAWANEWRQQCLANVGKRNKRSRDARRLREFPCGTKLKLGDRNETRVVICEISGRRCYKIIDRWIRVPTKYVLNYGFTVER